MYKLWCIFCIYICIYINPCCTYQIALSAFSRYHRIVTFVWKQTVSLPINMDYMNGFSCIVTVQQTKWTNLHNNVYPTFVDICTTGRPMATVVIQRTFDHVLRYNRCLQRRQMSLTIGLNSPSARAVFKLHRNYLILYSRTFRIFVIIKMQTKNNNLHQ